jgi:hypothetical protein
MPNEIQSLLESFVNRLTTVIDAEALALVRTNLLQAFGAPIPRRPGRPRKSLSFAQGTSVSSLVGTKVRKKAPIQLCPVPGCRNPAAPVFGMVCAKHKDVPKAKIKQYRAARRAQKAKTAGRSRAAKPATRKGRTKQRRAVQAKSPTRKAPRPKRAQRASASLKTKANGGAAPMAAGASADARQAQPTAAN